MFVVVAAAAVVVVAAAAVVAVATELCAGNKRTANAATPTTDTAIIVTGVRLMGFPVWSLLLVWL